MLEALIQYLNEMLGTMTQYFGEPFVSWYCNVYLPIAMCFHTLVMCFVGWWIMRGFIKDYDKNIPSSIKKIKI